MIKENRPGFSKDDALLLAREHWEIEGVTNVRELESERDQNFRLDDGSGPRWVLKVAAASDSRSILEFQNHALEHIAKKDPELPLPRLRRDKRARSIVEVVDSDGRAFLARMFAFLPGSPLARVYPRTDAQLRDVGRLFGRLDEALVGFAHPEQNRSIVWDSRRARDVVESSIPLLEDDPSRRLVEHYLSLYVDEVLPRLGSLPSGVIHNDGNDHNIVVRDGAVAGILDFGDMIESPLVVEVANAAAYAMLPEARRRPLDAAASIVSGYHESRPLGDEELEVLFPLVLTRLTMSVSVSARQFRDEPDKEYLRVSERQAWQVLERFSDVCPRLARDRFRLACRKEPHPGASRIIDWIREHEDEAASVLPLDPRSEPFHVLDLSIGSRSLGGLDVVEDVESFSRHVADCISAAGARVGIGRYDEARGIYTSAAFLSEGEDPRTVHLGIDLFAAPGTTVHAPLAGRVHSLQDNAAPLDYGPTVILEHRIDSDTSDTGTDTRFWTLYGHLAKSCLTELSEGQKVARGQAIAEIGDYPSNGNWPPHLHFQIVLDLLDKSGDFPGVAPPSERELWKALCPDPTRLLHLPPQSVAEADSPEALVERRRRHLSSTLSVSYAKPLHIVRGYGAHLYDAEGRPYLDLVNNVCHVGHAHPKVVRAAAEQMAVLNTNTRYLHENLVEYAERLTAKLPDPLNVCFFVNSGSEANDLALRLARNHTGRRGTMVLDGAYHGNLTSLIEVSPYKFDGPGGAGAPEHVTKLPMPDGYRGRFRSSEPQYAALYIEAVEETLRILGEGGTPPGVVLAESIMSCAGQIVLPPGYLKRVFELVRAAGGVAIADEVQVGFGRSGSHFWAFQAEEAMPDIVTMGKPIGNGHPIGAVVTTEEVARSFETGMEYFNTFGGNPVSCAAGLAVLEVLEEESLQENAEVVGRALLEGLRQLADRHAIIGDVRGRGLFVGFELVRDRDPERLEPAREEAKYLVNRMRDERFLTSTDGPFDNVIKLKPPLVIRRAEVDRYLSALDNVLQEERLRL